MAARGDGGGRPASGAGRGRQPGGTAAGTRADAAPLVTVRIAIRWSQAAGSTALSVCWRVSRWHTLQDASVTLEHPFEVVDFLSEEPSDYGIPAWQPRRCRYA